MHIVRAISVGRFDGGFVIIIHKIKIRYQPIFFGEGLGQGRLAYKRIATKRSSACPYKWGEVEGEEEM